MSGTPVLNTALNCLAGCSITRVRGILNGTTNYMLSEMENGKSFDDVLKEAQQLGYAEADPTGDVDGWDALAKVMILAHVLMKGKVTIDDVERNGISGITSSDIERARAGPGRSVPASSRPFLCSARRPSRRSRPGAW